MNNKVTVSWPNRVLHPNSRPHWAAKAKAAKKYRHEAYIACKAANVELPATEKIHLFVDFYAADKRHRDSDGLLTNVKNAIDGIADALEINDRRFIFHPFLMDEIVKGGKVVFTLTAHPEG